MFDELIDRLKEKLLRFLYDIEFKLWCKEIDLRKKLNIKNTKKQLNENT